MNNVSVMQFEVAKFGELLNAVNRGTLGKGR
jgi:hypothetical protein